MMKYNVVFVWWVFCGACLGFVAGRNHPATPPATQPGPNRWEYRAGPNGVPMRVNVGSGEAQFLRLLPAPPAIGEDLEVESAAVRVPETATH